VSGRRQERQPTRDRTGPSFWLAFYRDQARLIWEWRATRLSLVRRALLSFVAAAAALLIVATISPNLTLGGPGALLLAALLLTALNALGRPALLLVLSPLPAIVVPVAGLLLEVVIVLAIVRVVPGVRIDSLAAAIWDAVFLTVLNAIFAEILRASDDDSYHGAQVRQLVAREFGKPGSSVPGLLMVQLDGLSLPVLQSQMRAGRMPTLDRLVRSGESRIDPWFALLPPVTPVSQAGILHGNNDDIPGFRWFEKRSRTLLVANTPEGASEILSRRSDGHGLLADDGASIGNLLTGDAARSYLTMATIAGDVPTANDPPRLRGMFVSRVNYLRLVVLTIGDILKEFYQRERQRARRIEPRRRRDFHYALERALTNVSLRHLTTALVIEEMFGSAPSIYVDYTGYDCLAHHAGPERSEAADALDGLDRTIGSLLRATRDTPRPYRLVVLSDHGQCLGSPFSERYGELLEDVARRLMGDSTSRLSAVQSWEYHGARRMILGEIGRGRGLRPAIARRAARRRQAAAASFDEQELVVCASGNLAHLYLTFSDDRVDREQVDQRYPNLIKGLLDHPGVGLVLAHSPRHGPVALGRTGEHFLASGRVVGLDPLIPFGLLAAQSLSRLAGFTNTGDLSVIGPFDAATGEVVSYEDLVGSHGGLGGWQGQPFVLHPVDLPVADAPLVGAPAVHAELRRWLVSLRTGKALAPGKPSTDGIPAQAAAEGSGPTFPEPVGAGAGSRP
jgi:uncharacterized membrane protein YvlD (DUF360 family)